MQCVFFLLPFPFPFPENELGISSTGRLVDMATETEKNSSDPNLPHLLLILPFPEPVDLLDRIRQNHPQFKITYRHVPFTDTPFIADIKIPKGMLIAKCMDQFLRGPCGLLITQYLKFHQNYITMLQFLGQCPCSRNPKRTAQILVLAPLEPFDLSCIDFLSEFIQFFTAGSV